MKEKLFLYGVLCHSALREAVLGQGHFVRRANLPGYETFWAEGADYPVPVPSPGGAEGLLVDGLDAGARARVELFEAGFGYRAQPVTVDVEGDGTAQALAFLPEEPVATGPVWNLSAWARDWGEIWTEAAREAMRSAGQVTPQEFAARWPTIKMRAATRLRAARGPANVLRAGHTVTRDVEIVAQRYPYTNYFSVMDHSLKFRRFDGSMSQVVQRAGFVGGDAATVLPYDPEIDAVLLLEQFRAGPFYRGDPHPWTLEPVAGRLDPGEDAEACLRREAIEEAGLEIGRMHHIADYYPSPGAVTEFVYSYIGEARLSGRGGEVGGVEGEHEDIRSHVVPFETFMDLVASGEANTAPLIMSAFWLSQNRARLRRG